MFIITVSLIHFFPLIPFPYYCGCSFYWISGVDNGNINAAVSNFGPQHPPTHGALRLISILHGEIIQWITIKVILAVNITVKMIDSGILYWFFIEVDKCIDNGNDIAASWNWAAK